MCHSCTPHAARPLQRLVSRSVFLRAAYPVWIITVDGDDGPFALTATSVVPVSSEPPMVSLNVGKEASSLAALRSTRILAAHLLDASQRELATRFATERAVDPSDGDLWAVDDRGLPELSGSCARLELSVRELVPAGDSCLVLADVAAGAVMSSTPLSQQRGGFVSADRTVRSAA